MKRTSPCVLPLILACGGSSTELGPDPSGGGGGGGSPSIVTGSFSLTALSDGQRIAEASGATAELDYGYDAQRRVVIIRLADGEDRISLTIRDESAFGQYLLPGDYEVFGVGATSEGGQGSSDLSAFFDGREYYVNRAEGTLSVELHENQRLRGRLRARIQRTGASTPSHALEARFDARYVQPDIDGLDNGQGRARFSESINLDGAARIEDEGANFRVIVEDQASGSFIDGRVPKLNGALPVGTYGGAGVDVRGELLRDRGPTQYVDDGGGSIDIASTEGGILSGQLNFSGRGRSASGQGFSVQGVRAQFRAPLP
ncbi:MAG: hypothetical protein AAGD10_02450 [Myxococcota bacterium]